MTLLPKVSMRWIWTGIFWLKISMKSMSYSIWTVCELHFSTTTIPCLRVYVSINWRWWPLCSADSGQWDSALCHTDRRYQCLQWHCNERHLHFPSGKTQTGIAESQRLRACQFVEASASNLFHMSHHLLTKSYRVFGKGGPVLSSWSPSSLTCWMDPSQAIMVLLYQPPIPSQASRRCRDQPWPKIKEPEAMRPLRNHSQQERVLQMPGLWGSLPQEEGMQPDQQRTD